MPNIKHKKIGEKKKSVHSGYLSMKPKGSATGRKMVPSPKYDRQVGAPPGESFIEDETHMLDEDDDEISNELHANNKQILSVGKNKMPSISNIKVNSMQMVNSNVSSSNYNSKSQRNSFYKW